jgi:hypothetical protein
MTRLHSITHTRRLWLESKLWQHPRERCPVTQLSRFFGARHPVCSSQDRGNSEGAPSESSVLRRREPDDLLLAGIRKGRRSLFQKAETPERMRLISVDAIFSETLKRLCVSDSVSKRFDQV